jgi:hypothetical protein
VRTTQGRLSEARTPAALCKNLQDGPLSPAPEQSHGSRRLVVFRYRVVVLRFRCPRNFETSVVSTPASSNREAASWRRSRSWKFFRPAASRAFSQAVLIDPAQRLVASSRKPARSCGSRSSADSKTRSTMGPTFVVHRTFVQRCKHSEVRALTAWGRAASVPLARVEQPHGCSSLFAS